MPEPELHLAIGSTARSRFRERYADAAGGLEHHRAEYREPDGALELSQRDLLVRIVSNGASQSNFG
jgi:hypothetical protein